MPRATNPIDESYQYLQDLRNGDPLLTAEEERALAMRIAEGDTESRAKMIQSNLRLVVKIAREFIGRGLGMDDLIGEGNLGLIRATEEYDPSFGTRFSTYASYWIKQTIRHALINTTATIRLPTHMVQLLAKWKQAERALTEELGYPPSFDQIATSLGIKDAKKKLARRALQSRTIGYADLNEDGDVSMDLLPNDSSNGPLATFEDQELIQLMWQKLDRLDARERSIIIMRRGLNGQPPLTLKETGMRLGVTREWIRKVELRAEQKLRAEMEIEQPMDSASPTHRDLTAPAAARST